MRTHIQLDRLGAAPRPQWHATVVCALVLVVLAGLPAPCRSDAPSVWIVYLMARSDLSKFSARARVSPGAPEGYDGVAPVSLAPTDAGIYVLHYRQNGPSWTGPTGFYVEDLEPPIPLAGSHTWWDICAWAQNWSPAPPDRVGLSVGGSELIGFTGHLVLDQVPASANWSGPMEFWLDLSGTSYVTIPLAMVTDPLQGTRMHLTVYAPIPEPSSLAGLGFALAGVGIRVARRRR